MELHEVRQLREATSLQEAQKALDEGWILLGVAGSAEQPLYVLGSDKPKKQFSDLLQKLKGEQHSGQRQEDKERIDPSRK